MIFTTTRIRVEPEKRKELFQTICPIVNQWDQANGCLGSHLYLEIGDENTFMLIEEWQSRTDWNEHLRSDNFAVFLGAIYTLSNYSLVEFKLLSQTAGIEAISEVRESLH